MNLPEIQKALSELGMVAVPRAMSLREFCQVAGISESEVRHHPGRYDHLRVNLTARKNVFSAALVLNGLNKRSLKPGG
jgi:hypothetical protein